MFPHGGASVRQILDNPESFTAMFHFHLSAKSLTWRHHFALLRGPFVPYPYTCGGTPPAYVPCANRSDAIFFKQRGLMETEVAKKLFTVDEYYRMGEAGIFHPEARLELIEGEIIEMSPVGNRHVACVNRATALFSARLAGKVMVSVQNAVRLSRYTEPQPDILLARPGGDYY